MLRPGAAEYVKRVGGDAAEAMVSRAHNKFCTAGNGAEFADDQPVAEFRLIVKHVVFFEPGGILRIVVIGVFPDQDVGGGDDIPDKARGAVFVWKYRAGIGNGFHIVFSYFIRYF